MSFSIPVWDLVFGVVINFQLKLRPLGCHWNLNFSFHLYFFSFSIGRGKGIFIQPGGSRSPGFPQVSTDNWGGPCHCCLVRVESLISYVASIDMFLVECECISTVLIWPHRYMKRRNSCIFDGIQSWFFSGYFLISPPKDRGEAFC